MYLYRTASFMLWISFKILFLLDTDLQGNVAVLSILDSLVEETSTEQWHNSYADLMFIIT